MTFLSVLPASPHFLFPSHTLTRGQLSNRKTYRSFFEWNIKIWSKCRVAVVTVVYVVFGGWGVWWKPPCFFLAGSRRFNLDRPTSDRSGSAERLLNMTAPLLTALKHKQTNPTLPARCHSTLWKLSSVLKRSPFSAESMWTLRELLNLRVKPHMTTDTFSGCCFQNKGVDRVIVGKFDIVFWRHY